MMKFCKIQNLSNLRKKLTKIDNIFMKSKKKKIFIQIICANVPLYYRNF